MEKETSVVRALERGIKVLFALEAAGKPMSLSELAAAIELSNATTLRMIATLEDYGLVEKAHSGYRLGLSVLPLTHGYLLGNELTLAALPVLQDLARSTGEAVSLFVRFGFERIVIQRVDGPTALRYLYPAGQRLPLYLGVGKVLAAAMRPDEIEYLLSLAEGTRMATGEPFSRERFLAEIEHVRQVKHAVSVNERVMGVASVAAPVVNVRDETIAAVNIAGPSDRMVQARLEELSIEVRRAAKAISDQCGYTERAGNTGGKAGLQGDSAALQRSTDYTM
ncbi:IclR family transcriptional regulator [bacterium]|nr:IclR family transcriptional regulator [bacterium]